MAQRNIIRGQIINKEKLALAKEFRRNMTGAEKTLWQNVRANKLGGWHFRRQQILFGYIVDFYCHAASLVVEVDGEIHSAASSRNQMSVSLRGLDVLPSPKQSPREPGDCFAKERLAATRQKKILADSANVER